MPEQEKNLSRELRVPELPEVIHLKIERFMIIMELRTGRRLTKPEAVEQLLSKATKNIKLVEAA